MTRKPERSDVLLALGLAVFVSFLFLTVGSLVESDREITPLSYVIAVLACLLVMFRRIHPVATLVAIGTLILGYLALGLSPGPIGLPLWIGLYTVAVERDRRTSLMVAGFSAMVVSIVVIWVAPDRPTGLERLAAVGLTLLPLLIGDAVRSRRALIAEADERVRLAEEASEQEAQRRVQDERVRIARELHDVVAHSIANINVQAGMAAHVIDFEPAVAKDALVEIKDASKSAMGELRAMLGVLRDEDEEVEDPTPLAPSPDIDDIDDLVERFAGAASLEITGTPAQPVDPAVGLVAYRIVQESLTNTLKHAREAIVEVAIDFTSDGIDLAVIDDGGLGPGDEVDGAGLGLVGLVERARSVGGTLRAEPRFGEGFAVRATVPYIPSGAGAGAA